MAGGIGAICNRDRAGINPMARAASRQNKKFSKYWFRAGKVDDEGVAAGGCALMCYPSESDVRKRLLPYRCVLWTVAVALPGFGYIMETRGWSSALAKSGGVILLIIVYVYFHLESREFLTGQPGNLIDSDNHFVPKKIIGGTNFFTSLIGSAVTIFGDWRFPFITCGAIKC